MSMILLIICIYRMFLWLTILVDVQLIRIAKKLFLIQFGCFVFRVFNPVTFNFHKYIIFIFDLRDVIIKISKCLANFGEGYEVFHISGYCVRWFIFVIYVFIQFTSFYLIILCLRQSTSTEQVITNIQIKRTLNMLFPWT